MSQVVISQKIRRKADRKLREAMPGLAITINVYAKSEYNSDALSLLINEPDKLISIIDKVLQNNLAKKIVINNLVASLLGACSAGAASDELVNEIEQDIAQFTKDIRKVIDSCKDS